MTIGYERTGESQRTNLSHASRIDCGWGLIGGCAGVSVLSSLCGGRHEVKAESVTNDAK